MYGIGHANDERKDEYDDERHERASVPQPGRTSPSDQLTLHSVGHLLPPSGQVLDATSGGVRLIKGPTRLSGVVQNPYVYKIMCKAFLTMLKGLAKVWFSKIAFNTVSTFKELSGHFIAHFIGK